ncbi:MAG: PAS domain S-box protein, partial [Chitinivibrionales bacterium]|nr:PAS domain S-box protein [Chitinivibrionales bacterium]
MDEAHRNLQTQYKEILNLRDFYSHIMHNMGEAVIWLDKDGKITFANDAFNLLVQTKPEETTNTKFRSFLSNHGSMADFLEMTICCRRSPGIPITRELGIVVKEGVERIGQTNCIWIPSDTRAPGFLITIRDITEAKKIERQLFMAEDRYRALYENSPAIIVALNYKGYFIYANPAMVEQCGYTEEELKTMHFGQLVAPEAEFDVDRLLKNLLTGQTRLQEVHFKTKSGEWKCTAFNTYPIFDSDKKMAGVAGIGVDITETKRLNEQLIKAQRMELLGQLAGGLAHDFNNLLTSISGYSQFIQMQAGEDKIKKYAETIAVAGNRASDLVKNLLAFSRGEVG